MTTVVDNVQPNNDIENPITMEALQQFVRGEITLQELNRIQPQDLAVIAKYGERLIDQDQLAIAQVIFEGLTSLNPYIGQFHTMLGVVLMRSQQWEAATIEFSSAIGCNHDDVVAFANRAECYLRLEKPDEGALDLAKVLDLEKHTPIENLPPASARAFALAMLLAEPGSKPEQPNSISK